MQGRTVLQREGIYVGGSNKQPINHLKLSNSKTENERKHRERALYVTVTNNLSIINFKLNKTEKTEVFFEKKTQRKGYFMRKSNKQPIINPKKLKKERKTENRRRKHKEKVGE